MLLCAAAHAAKPVFAVLPLASEGDEGRIGRSVRKSLFEKLARTYQYVMVNLDDIDNAAAEAGFRLAPDTPPAKVAEFAANVLQCRFVAWGLVTRASKGWVIRVQAMDLDESRKDLKWQIDQPVAGYREVPLACAEIVAEISGFRREPAREPEVPEAKRCPEPRRNLLPNGDFEQGRDTPSRWQQIDNLTTFWEVKSKSGRGLLVDTDVLEEQALQWREKIKNGADFRKPPQKLPTRPPKYDTIAATYGIHFISDPLPVKRGVVYRLSADVKGLSVDIFFPKVFAKGYASFDATEFEAQDREIYRAYLACRSTTGGREFEGHTRTFLPNPFYVVFDLEGRADPQGAATVAQRLRSRMAQRNFPLIPLDEQKRRLAAGSSIGFEAPPAEIIATTRDRLRCAHAVYGKVDGAGKDRRLSLRLLSARADQSVPLLDLSYPAGSDAAIASACDKFLDACEKRLPFVACVGVIPYSYWPPGPFRYDNIALTEEGDTLW